MAQSFLSQSGPLLCVLVGFSVSIHRFVTSPKMQVIGHERESCFGKQKRSSATKAKCMNEDMISMIRETMTWNVQSPVSAISIDRDKMLVGSRFGLVCELNRRGTSRGVEPLDILHEILRSDKNLYQPQVARTWWNGSREILAVIPIEKDYLVIHESGTVLLGANGDVTHIGTLDSAICVSVGQRFAVFGLSHGRAVRVVDLNVKPLGSIYADYELGLQEEDEDLWLDERVCEVDAQDDSVIACCGRTATIFNLHDLEKDGILLRLSTRITCVALSRTNIAITAGIDGVAQSWDSATGELVAKFDRHQSAIYSLDLLENGCSAVTGSGGYNDSGEDFSVWVWQPRTGESLFHITQPTGLVSSVTFLRPNGRFLAAASWDGKVREFDLFYRERMQFLAFAEVSSRDLPQEVLMTIFDLLA